MDFATLKTRLEAQIGRAPSDMCYEMTTASINTELFVEDRVLSETYATPAASQALPSDFVQAKSIYFEQGENRRAVPLVSKEHFDAEYRVTGTTIMAAIEGSNLFLNPVEGGSVTMSYYAAFPDLSADSDTNAVLTRHPQVYVYGVLAHHNALIRSGEAAMYFAAFKEAMGEARIASNRKRTGGMSAAPMPRVAP